MSTIFCSSGATTTFKFCIFNVQFPINITLTLVKKFLLFQIPLYSSPPQMDSSPIPFQSHKNRFQSSPVPVNFHFSIPFQSSPAKNLNSSPSPVEWNNFWESNLSSRGCSRITFCFLAIGLSRYSIRESWKEFNSRIGWLANWFTRRPD